MNFKTYLMLSLALMSFPTITYLSSLYAECCSEDTFRDRPLSGPGGTCTWERGDGRCNVSSDCCPGRECDGFGFCQRCQ